MASESQRGDLENQTNVPASSSSPENWPQKRLQLLNWFRRNAEPLADAYEGAIRLLHDKCFPGRLHFVAHAVRDIADRLPFVLDPQLESNRVQYEDQMDGIEKLWPKIQVITGAGKEPNTHDTLVIDYELASRIDSLVQAHRKRRQRPSNHELLLRVFMRNEPTRASVNQRLVRAFKEMRDWFMKFAHVRHSKGPAVNEDELQTQFSKFEGMLYSFVGDFFTGIAELDDILQQANESRGR